MTREEALEWLISRKEHYELDDNCQELALALGMATKALSAEPCKDAISRQAALASIKALYPDMPIVDIMGAKRKWLEKYAPYFECENAIEYLPSVTPKQKMGHWIDREVYDADRWKCSECGRTEPYKENFCPNCGAKMVEPQESGDKE